MFSTAHSNYIRKNHRGQALKTLRKHPYFRDKQNKGGVSGKIRLGVEKTVCSDFWIHKTRLFSPSEVKEARFQASLSSPAERNRARSAFKRFFHP
jgi:hypothetical protein